MGHPKYSEEDFLRAALAIVAERGVSEVTVAAVSERLGSPTGSFYHRFASRDALLGSLWLRAVLQFQAGMSAALEAGDGLKAALHTPAWVRKHPDEARLLLLYDRKDFLHGEWPRDLRERVADMTQRMEVSIETLGTRDLRQGRARRGPSCAISGLRASRRGGAATSRARRAAAAAGRPHHPDNLRRCSRGLSVGKNPPARQSHKADR